MINPSPLLTQQPEIPSTLTIGELRRLWMRRQRPRVTLTKLAEISGVSIPRMSAVLNQDFASEHHISTMRKVGMPENLLPNLPDKATQ